MQQVYNPYAQYRNQRNHLIESADRVTLVSMLLEGAINYNKKALLALEQDDRITVLESINYATKIVLHLYSCLNFEEGGEIADRLAKLYHFICEQYVVYQKNIKNTVPVITINRILSSIHEGWKTLPNTAGREEQQV
ncbi:MAG: flagellar protein FliS [Deltaproteobacteria bacterium]|nr:flagellar protein FliS [Deltaproteobacteria bacterium]